MKMVKVLAKQPSVATVVRSKENGRKLGQIMKSIWAADLAFNSRFDGKQ